MPSLVFVSSMKNVFIVYLLCTQQSLFGGDERNVKDDLWPH